MIPETVYAMARALMNAESSAVTVSEMIAHGIMAVVNLIKPETRREGLIIGNTVRRINDGVTP